MPELQKPSANRLRKPSWKDSRLLVGLALVLLATALGAFALRAADSRVSMYAAREVLLPGQQLQPEQLKRVDVQLSNADAQYLAVSDALPQLGFVLREIRPGELVPKSAVGTQAQVTVQPLALTVDAASSAVLVTGSVVDVYANKPTGASTGEKFAGPEKVLGAVTVARVSGGGSGLGVSSLRSGVQLLVPTGKVGDVIALVDAGAKITLVPVPGSALKASS